MGPPIRPTFSGSLQLSSWGLTEYAKMLCNLLGNGGTWFASLHGGDVGSYDLGPSLQKSPFADRIPGWLAETHRLLHQTLEKRLSQS